MFQSTEIFLAQGDNGVFCNFLSVFQCSVMNVIVTSAKYPAEKSHVTFLFADLASLFMCGMLDLFVCMCMHVALW